MVIVTETGPGMTLKLQEKESWSCHSSCSSPLQDAIDLGSCNPRCLGPSCDLLFLHLVLPMCSHWRACPVVNSVASTLQCNIHTRLHRRSYTKFGIVTSITNAPMSVSCSHCPPLLELLFNVRSKKVERSSLIIDFTQVTWNLGKWTPTGHKTSPSVA